MTKLTTTESITVRRATLRLAGQAWGIAVGALLGASLFVATVILVLKGGPNVGQHLGLLSVFLPGYGVTIVGAFVGFIYMFVIGYAIGRLIGLLYNFVAAPPK